MTSAASRRQRSNGNRRQPRPAVSRQQQATDRINNMKANLRYFLFFVISCLCAASADGQVDSATRHAADTLGMHRDSTILRHHLAVFIPLYLDSAFDAGNNYRYDKNFPKFINPGLEFYEGIQLALDSLQKEQAQLDVQVYDTRSNSQTLTQIL